MFLQALHSNPDFAAALLELANLRIVSKKLRPKPAEVARNPRARSALLRVGERLA